MDILDVFEIGSVTKGRVGRAVAAVGALTIFGWTQRWPIAYPVVQAAVEGRAEQMTDMIMSAFRHDK